MKPTPAIDTIQKMNEIQFKNVHYRVRPQRIAVLVSEGSSDWQETCREIMHVLPTIWGGKYSLIIPTDGVSIRPPFWELLQAYDPDYICALEWSLWDRIERRPDTYDDYFLKWKSRDSVREELGEDAAGLKAAFENFAREHRITSITLSSDLEKDLKSRLAPFFFDYNVLKTLSRLKADASYPFTSTQTILPHCKHSEELMIPYVTAEGLPPLWVESITGNYSKATLAEIEGQGVKVEVFAMDDNTACSRFAQLLGVGGDATEDLSQNAFNFSMLRLAQYRKPGIIDSAITVVCGSTLLDFSLFFSLRAIRGRVYWLPSEWIDRFEDSRIRARKGEGAVRPNEEYARGVAQRLVNESMKMRPQNIYYVSLSLGESLLSQTAAKLADCPFSFGDRLRGPTKIITDIKELMAHPLRVLNVDAFGTATNQLLGDQLAGYFPTPKPKGFSEIVSYDHRWITELEIEGQDYPRHPALGTFLAKERTLTTDDVRSGRDGVCYLCPNSIYFGGDVDSILRRPEIRVPTAAEVFEHLASLAGLKSKLSDKGFYAQEFLRKLGGLANAAAFLRSNTSASVLKEFRKPGDSKAGGCFLSSDRRRYLDLEALKILAVSNDVNEFVDGLVRNEILHRGLVLKCRYCRTADWFSIAEIGELFRCNRCRLEQSILSANLFARPEPTWYYKLDELVYQGITNNMHVPLLALDRLRRSAQSFMHADEHEFVRRSEEKPLIEVDICCIADGMLTIGEAKVSDRVADTASGERAALREYRELATLLGAEKFILASEVDWSPRTKEIAAELFQGTNISVHTLGRADLYS